MEPDAEQDLLSAKFAEARAWPEGWCCDGVDDYDDEPTRTMAMYRADFSDLDAHPVHVEVEFHDSSRPTYLVHFNGLEWFEVPDRAAAIAKYDELLGSVDRCASSISSQVPVAAASEQ